MTRKRKQARQQVERRSVHGTHSRRRIENLERRMMLAAGFLDSDHRDLKLTGLGLAEINDSSIKAST